MSEYSGLVHQNKSINYLHLHRRFFVKVDRVLRRSLGVSESAKAKVDIKPAPEVDPTDLEGEAPETPQYVSEEMLDDSINQMVFDLNTGENVHDEL